MDFRTAAGLIRWYLQRKCVKQKDGTQQLGLVRNALSSLTLPHLVWFAGRGRRRWTQPAASCLWCCVFPWNHRDTRPHGRTAGTEEERDGEKLSQVKPRLQSCLYSSVWLYKTYRRSTAVHDILWRVIDLALHLHGLFLLVAHSDTEDPEVTASQIQSDEVSLLYSDRKVGGEEEMSRRQLTEIYNKWVQT